ncbi:MAG: glutamine-hydrolyzing GMP synthase [Spirochaetaceae bacterium]|nr:glutamine-hydrolyzing GMP synthase [Spirochaetaceae bacterium]
MDTILILDYGSQYTQLIGRRIRELGVYAEILPGDADVGAKTGPADLQAAGPAVVAGQVVSHYVGIVLSGSPFSAYDEAAPRPHPSLYESRLPVLGICYGIQRMTLDSGGQVSRLVEREYGRKLVHKTSKGQANSLLKGLPAEFSSWMSHGDSVVIPGNGWEIIAESEGGIPAALAHASLPRWGVQFHPEVSHCECGLDILGNFVLGICKAKPEWSMGAYLEQTAESLKCRVGESPVLLLISGGVDSTVTGALLLKTLDPEKVYLLYIDTGLMRAGESEEVMENLARLGARHLFKVDAEERFLEALRGESDPERKRRIIGDLFVRIQEEEVARLGIPEAYLVQGTLYTDLIESGKGVGNKAQTIKSHHNVRSPLIMEKRAKGLVIEPLDRLYKDEVRALGRLLGLPESIVSRHPFPGPGLGVRILGEVTKEKCDILRQADQVYIEELRSRGLYNKIWQAFCVLLPVRAVGVAGDERTYGYVVALRAVVSEDGMTAGVYPFDPADLVAISTAITNRNQKVGRVVYDVSSKPPATIEWE